jgi:hypothetical protein
MNLKDKFIATLDRAFGSNYDKLGPNSFFTKEKIKNAVNTETNKFPTLKSESKKKETKETTSSGSSGGFVPSLQFKENKQVKKLTEAERTAMAKLRDLSKKYACKGSKDCTDKDKIEDTYEDLKKQYAIGLKVEKEHKSGDPKQIVIDHLSEDPNYYSKLKKMEFKEMTSSASSGQYTGAAFLAKSQSKQDWKPSQKKQWKGGQFVKVKDKCNKFPYCNQGIGALEFFENENIKESVKNLSRQYGLSKETIIKILSESLKLK